MDIIATTGAIVGIVDVVTRSIFVLRTLRDKYKTAALMISNLITQLTSLKAALDKISEWIASDLVDAPQHHQLIIDLEEAIVCCRVLVQSVGEEIERLEQNDEGSLDVHSRIQVVLKTQKFEEFQTFISRQISALGLLLTACNWYVVVRLELAGSALLTWIAKHSLSKRTCSNMRKIVRYWILFAMTRPHYWYFGAQSPQPGELPFLRLDLVDGP